jgi:hypothetical protein
MARANFFVTHGPTGIRSHFELDSALTPEDARRFMTNAKVLLDWLAAQSFGPDSQPTSEPGGETRPCPECGEPMKHRRGTAKSGKEWSGWFCSVRSHKTVWDEDA